jgi:hypothetical protein
MEFIIVLQAQASRTVLRDRMIISDGYMELQAVLKIAVKMKKD